MHSLRAAKRHLTIRVVPWIFILMALASIFVYFTFWSYGLLNFWDTVILLGAIASLAYFGEFVFITFDRNQRLARFKQIRVWRQTLREIPFEDFHTISVEETWNQRIYSTTSIFRILFVLKTGECFHLANLTTPHKANMIKIVQNMADFMNDIRPQVTTALDGIVRIKHDGITRSTRWQIEFVANNDKGVLTRWKTDSRQLSDGFLLVTPNIGGNIIIDPDGTVDQRGWVNIASSQVFSNYLETMDLTIHNLPNFNNLEVKGKTIGVNNQFNVLTNNVAATQAWFDFEKNQVLLTWMQSNPLKAGKENLAPYFLVTPQEFMLFFRGNYPDQQQVDVIKKFGIALTHS